MLLEVESRKPKQEQGMRIMWEVRRNALRPWIGGRMTTVDAPLDLITGSGMSTACFFFCTQLERTKETCL